MRKIDISTKKYPDTYTLVDDEDHEHLNQWKWYPKNCRGKIYIYRHAWIEDKKNFLAMHRSIMNPSKDMQIDHINGNTLDNRRSNLRICTASQNLQNQKIRSYNCSSKYKGVCFDKATNKWRAQIMFDKKIKHIGFYKIEEDAARAYNNKAKKWYGEFANLNKLERDHEDKNESES